MPYISSIRLRPSFRRVTASEPSAACTLIPYFVLILCLSVLTDKQCIVTWSLEEPEAALVVLGLGLAAAAVAALAVALVGLATLVRSHLATLAVTHLTGSHLY